MICCSVDAEIGPVIWQLIPGATSWISAVILVHGCFVVARWLWTLVRCGDFVGASARLESGSTCTYMHKKNQAELGIVQSYHEKISKKHRRWECRRTYREGH